MMSLSTANLMDIVKKQYLFKLKANIDAFSSLVGIQVLAILFSLGGSSIHSSSSEGFYIEIKYYSADIVVVFTMIWALVTAITITTKQYRNNDFTFVTNRISSSLSNILFLLTASFVGALTAVLSRYLIQMIGLIIYKEEFFTTAFAGGEILLGLVAALIYIFTISSIGYLVGALIQINKLFAVLFPVLMIGSLFLDATMDREPSLIKIFQFYVMESSIFLFIIKMVLTSALFFLASIGILNRMEVRR